MSAAGTPWCKLHAGLPDHPKVWSLCDVLDIDLAQAMGHLVHLWCRVTMATPDGHLSGCTDRQIAKMAGWVGDHSAFVAALVEVRFLDDGEDGYQLHNWMEYAEGYKRAQAQKDRRTRAPRKTPRVPHAKGTGSEREPHTDTTRAQRGEERRGAERKGEETNTPVELAPDVDVAGPLFDAKPSKPPARGIDAAIAKVYAHYRGHRPKILPTLKKKSKEWGKARDRLEEGFSVAQLCQAIDGYFVSPHHCGQNDRNTKFQSFELIMRDKTRVENGWDYLEAAKGTPSKSAAPTRPPGHDQLEALGTKLGLSVFGSRRCTELIEAFGGSEVAAQALRDATENGAKMLRSADVAALIKEARAT